MKGSVLNTLQYVQKMRYIAVYCEEFWGLDVDVALNAQPGHVY